MNKLTRVSSVVVRRLYANLACANYNPLHCIFHRRDTEYRRRKKISGFSTNIPVCLGNNAICWQWGMHRL